MTVQAQVVWDDKEFRELLTKLASRGGGGVLKKSLRSVARSGLGTLITHVTKNKLRGQYLNRRTGTLIRSITSSPKIELLDNPARVRGTFGSKLDYAKKHEEGFKGTEQVPAHTRKAAQVKAHMNRGHQVPAHKRKAHKVMAHTRKAEYRARHFLRDTVKDKAPVIGNRLYKALEIAIRTGKAPTVAELRGVV